MNNDAIRAMIAAHPQASDAEIVALFRGTEDIWIDVPVSDMEGVCRTAGIISRLEDLIDGNPSPGLPRTAAKELVGLIGGKLSRLEMSNPGKRLAILAMLGALVAVEWIDADEQAAILALGRAQSSVAAARGCGLIDQMDDASAALVVAAARAG